MRQVIVAAIIVVMLVVACARPTATKPNDPPQPTRIDVASDAGILGDRPVASAEAPTAPPDAGGDGVEEVDPAEELARARKRAVVREGDLKLASGAVIPGPCWDVALHAAVQGGFTEPTTFGTNLSVDLDGDGTLDVGVHCGSRMFFSTYRFYVMRDKCGYYAGAIETAGIMKETKVSVKGLHELDASWACGDGGGPGPQHARWSFDGRRFTRSKRWTDKGAKRCNDPEDTLEGPE